jgi:hypothetical protein
VAAPKYHSHVYLAHAHRFLHVVGSHEDVVEKLPIIVTSGN